MGVGLEAALAGVPEDSEGLGCDFLPERSHVFTRGLDDICHPNYPDLSLNRALLWVVITPLSANSSFGSRSCLLDTNSKSSEASISCCTEQPQLIQEWGEMDRDVCVCVCVFACVCLIKGWAGG